jgi:hypothetical protein
VTHSQGTTGRYGTTPDVARAALLNALRAALQQELAAVDAQARDAERRLHAVEGQLAVVQECVRWECAHAASRCALFRVRCERVPSSFHAPSCSVAQLHHESVQRRAAPEAGPSGTAAAARPGSG